MLATRNSGNTPEMCKGVFLYFVACVAKCVLHHVNAAAVLLYHCNMTTTELRLRSENVSNLAKILSFISVAFTWTHIRWAERLLPPPWVHRRPARTWCLSDTVSQTPSAAAIKPRDTKCETHPNKLSNF